MSSDWLMLLCQPLNPAEAAFRTKSKDADSFSCGREPLCTLHVALAPVPILDSESIICRLKHPSQPTCEHLDS